MFLLRREGFLGGLYEVLRTSFIASCCNGGGLRVLMPFCIISAMNAVFNMLIIIQFPILCFYTVVTTSLAVLEAISAYYAWQIYQVAAAGLLYPGDGPMLPGAAGAPGGLFGGGGQSPLLGGGGGGNVLGGGGGRDLDQPGNRFPSDAVGGGYRPPAQNPNGSPGTQRAGPFQPFMGQGNRLSD